MINLGIYAGLVEQYALPYFCQERFGPRANRRPHRNMPDRTAEAFYALIIHIAGKDYAPVIGQPMDAGLMRLALRIVGMGQGH